jgi:hypothetical protein
MPPVTLVFNHTNDPEGFAKRHVGRQIAKGLTPEVVVRDAWRHRHDFVPKAITNNSWPAPPRLVAEISYDPTIVDDASELQVIDALIKAAGVNANCSTTWQAH